MFGQATGSAIAPFVRSTATLLGYRPERATRREESEGVLDGSGGPPRSMDSIPHTHPSFGPPKDLPRQGPN